jgi:NAD(P)-dependent dehydrogenase (short-subunit alcohol dehydrogenase family)
MRAVVVGASSGLGRCIAIGLGKRGASVALLARRMDRLVDAAKEAGRGAVPIVCDVTKPSSCRVAIEEAAKKLGGIDALVYSTGIGPLRRLVDLDADTWQRTFETNVTGAALVTAAAIPHLTASGGAAAYLTSISASLTPPWPGLAAHRDARRRSTSWWRPGASSTAIGFTRVIVVSTGGEGPSMTEFSAGWDPELAAEWCPCGSRQLPQRVFPRGGRARQASWRPCALRCQRQRPPYTLRS